jgi:hypothetical protein
LTGSPFAEFAAQKAGLDRPKAAVAITRTAHLFRIGLPRFTAFRQFLVNWRATIVRKLPPPRSAIRSHPAEPLCGLPTVPAHGGSTCRPVTHPCRAVGRRGYRPGGPPAARALAVLPRRTSHSRMRGVSRRACCRRVSGAPWPCGEPAVAGEAVDRAASLPPEQVVVRLDPGELQSRGLPTWQRRTRPRVPRAG